ncbi:hypothetical protein GGF50DRAFT_120089 [Schizophyllum commune]
MPNAPTAPTTAKGKKHVAFAQQGRSTRRNAAKGSTSGAKRSAPAKPFRPKASRMVFGFLVTEECMREYVRLHPEDVYLPKWASDPDERASQIRSVKNMLERNIPQACRDHFPSLPQFKEIRIGVTDGRRYGNAVILADTDSRDTVTPPPPHIIEEVAKYIGQEGVKPEWFYVDVVA